MTIAAGFEFNAGILLCADTKITEAMQSNDTKISAWEWGGACRAAFTFSGNVAYARAAIREVRLTLDSTDFTKEPLERVQTIIQDAVAKFYAAHVFAHPDRESADFELLIGLWLFGQLGLFHSRETVINRVFGYDCIGSGSYLAKFCVRQGCDPQEWSWPGSLTIEDVGLIANYALKAAMTYDQYCGGEAEFLILNKDGTIGNNVTANLYPGEDFTERVQSEMWKMFRKLSANVLSDREVREAIDGFKERVDKLHDGTKFWRNMVVESLRKSMKPTPSASRKSKQGR